ncbi:2-amino-4-hydroxy-6-hydroxymethyldihydropteridine diphosphokinase [Bacteroides sp. AN502(2024)]|uniref:2-amino-4-hydroxy-6- hydroxymethyldihydropteridine diphosphokinase n=1 Tax=Bacteroides sp. AN502(2024) TaxID=3160599 RepID=UPI00351926EA
MHKYIVCIGSNYNRKENLIFARQKLTELFSSICFAPELETQPLFFKNPALFSNQVVLFFSDKEEETVRKMLKEIERRSGRHPEDKKQEKVCLDIDMLLYDNQILKPEDWQRRYIQQSLSAFHSSLFSK